MLLGAVSRYSFGLVALALIGNRFPWATLGVNVVGSFLIGLAAVLIGDRIVDGELWRPLIIVGFLGAFTTFSAFSLDTPSVTAAGQLQYRFSVYAWQCSTVPRWTVSGMQLAKFFA